MQRLSLLLVIVSVFIVGYSKPTTQEGSEKMSLGPRRGIEEAEMEQKDVEELVGSFLNLLNNYAQNRLSPESQEQQMFTDKVLFHRFFRPFLNFIKIFLDTVFKSHNLPQDQKILKKTLTLFLNFLSTEASKSYSPETGIERHNQFLELLSDQGGTHAAVENRKAYFRGYSYPSQPFFGLRG